MYARPARTWCATSTRTRAVKVIVFRGAGEKSFASGADISEFEARARQRARPHAATTRRSPAPSTRIEGLTKPTIAMIHGYCIGGGAGLALACDIRFADTKVAVRDHARQARTGLQPRVDQADGRPGRPVACQVGAHGRAADPGRSAPTSWACSTSSPSPRSSRSSPTSSPRPSPPGPSSASAPARRWSDGSLAGQVARRRGDHRPAQLARSTPRTTPRACGPSSASAPPSSGGPDMTTTHQHHAARRRPVVVDAAPRGRGRRTRRRSSGRSS